MKQKNCLKFVSNVAFLPIQPFGQLQSVFRIRIHWVRIRIQHFRLNIDPDPDPGFWWPKILKNLKLKTFDIFFLFKNRNLLNPRPPKRTSKLQEKSSALKRDHPALQNMKILKFFQFLWVIFALQDPDPLTWLKHWLHYILFGHYR